METVIVVIIIGIVSAMTWPLLSNALRQQRVQNAAAAVENMYVKARTIAQWDPVPGFAGQTPE